VNIIVLNPGKEELAWSCFGAGSRVEQSRGRAEDYRFSDREQDALSGLIHKVIRDFEQATGAETPELIAVRVSFGGSIFTEPTVYSNSVRDALKQLVPDAPLHIPPLLALLEAWAGCFAGVPIVLVFETAYFENLPPREQSYGLSPEDASTCLAPRRGFNGLYHETAGRLAVRECRRLGIEMPRFVSVCLEPRPEVMAAIGGNPVMVTGGATPLEGLPGEKTCGELDPAIVLTLARDMNWGPDQINRVLSRESGVLGLTGREATLPDVLAARDGEELAPARDLIRYQILKACGMGMAATSGLDAIVFSGRYARVAAELGPWLIDRLTLPGANRARALISLTLEETLERIVADQAASAIPLATGASAVTTSAASVHGRDMSRFALK